MACRENRKKHCTMALTSTGPQQVSPNGPKPICKNNNCHVETHKVQGNAQSLTGNIPIQIFVPGFREELVVFEDYTENHNKTFLQLSAESSPLTNSFSALDVNIYTRDSEEPIQFRLSTNPTGPVFTGIPKGIQVENFVRLTVTNPLEEIGTLRVYVEKTFCICCRDNEVQG